MRRIELKAGEIIRFAVRAKAELYASSETRR
jgi:hypothetical protein